MGFDDPIFVLLDQFRKEFSTIVEKLNLIKSKSGSALVITPVRNEKEIVTAVKDPEISLPKKQEDLVHIDDLLKELEKPQKQTVELEDLVKGIF